MYTLAIRETNDQGIKKKTLCFLVNHVFLVAQSGEQTINQRTALATLHGPPDACDVMFVHIQIISLDYKTDMITSTQ